MENIKKFRMAGMALSFMTGLASSSFAQEASAQYPEQFFPVDTALVERSRSFPGFPNMPYTEILVFPRTVSGCFAEGQNLGEMLNHEFYLQASPKDLGIIPAGSMQKDQEIRDAFVARHGDKIQQDLQQIWENTLSLDYAEILTGFQTSGRPQIEPYNVAVRNMLDEFEEDTGISVRVNTSEMSFGPACGGA